MAFKRLCKITIVGGIFLLYALATVAHGAYHVDHHPNHTGHHYNDTKHHRHIHHSDTHHHAHAYPTHAQNSGWVRVNGTEFSLNGRPFYVNGFNGFWLPYMAQDHQNWPEITSFLERARDLGFNVFRTNGWRNAVDDPDAWQTSPGHYNHDAMLGLDFVISEAKRLGFKVLIPFGNNWPDYGGKLLYVQWANGPQGGLHPEDKFFTDERTKGLFKDYINMLLNRVNHFTGVKYSQDPTIFSWELLNEPRCHSDPSGGAVEAWTNEISAFVKSIDNKHLLSNGAEGFYINPHERLNGEDPRPGIDFVRHNLNPDIDYASAHFYPKWMPWLRTLEGQLRYAQDWVAEHKYDAHVTLQKPVLFGEFGLGNSNFQEKLVFFHDVFQDIFGGAEPATGGCIWVLYGDTIPPRDWESNGIVVRIGELEHAGYSGQRGPPK